MAGAGLFVRQDAELRAILDARSAPEGRVPGMARVNSTHHHKITGILPRLACGQTHLHLDHFTGLFRNTLVFQNIDTILQILIVFQNRDFGVFRTLFCKAGERRFGAGTEC